MNAKEVSLESWVTRNIDFVRSVVAGAILLVAWILESWTTLPDWVVILIYLCSYGFGAYEVIVGMVSRLRERRFSFDIDLLMLLAAIGAASIGEWVEGGFLLFLFSLANAGEHYALGKARNAINSLSELVPTQVRVLKNNKESEIPIDQVSINDIAIVRPGERIPVDGIVRAGFSTVNQAPITGESVPVEKSDGDEVFAGTLNGEGALEILTTRALGDRTLDRVIQLVEEAQTQKAPTQLFTDRFQKVFVPLTIIVDILLITLPPLLGIWTFYESFYRAMSLLVAASPCALALGTPATVLAGIAQAARFGVLIKGGEHLENLGTVTAIAFDKTGTITVGKPAVMEVRLTEGVTTEEIFMIAATVEHRSQHPLARAIVDRAEELGLELGKPGEVQSVTGRGLRSTIDEVEIAIGTLGLWEIDGVDIPEVIRGFVLELQDAGNSTVVVRRAEDWLGVIGIADRPRLTAKSTLMKLRELGIKPLVMLTGDNEGVGQAIGREVGIDEVHSGLLPEDKVGKLRELERKYGRIAMIGDGVNDAPAIATATVGIAMGGAGSAVALETADVVLMGDDLSRLPFAIALSRKSRTVIRQNLFFALGVIAILVVSSIFGFMSIGPTVVIHEGSTLLVIANALRLLNFNGLIAKSD